MKLFFCLYVLLMCMYVHFLEIKYQVKVKYVIDESKYHNVGMEHGLKHITLCSKPYCSLGKVRN